MKMNNPGVSQKVISGIITAVIVVVGIVIGFWSAGKEDRSIKNTDKYEEQSMSECSIMLPDVLESEKGQNPAGGKCIGFFTCENAAVSVDVYSGSFTQEDIIHSLEYRSINGVKLEPRVEGNFVIADYKSQVIVGSKNEDGHYVVGYYIAEDKYYEITTSCLSGKYDDYKSYMEDWITSFKLS